MSGFDLRQAGASTRLSFHAFDSAFMQLDSGRPSEYLPEYVDQAAKLCRLGDTAAIANHAVIAFTDRAIAFFPQGIAFFQRQTEGKHSDAERSELDEFAAWLDHVAHQFVKISSSPRMAPW
jgi:hypothetical protein